MITLPIEGSDIKKKVPTGRPTKKQRHLTQCNMCLVLYLAVHNKTCTGQLISVI